MNRLRIWFLDRLIAAVQVEIDSIDVELHTLPQIRREQADRLAALKWERRQIDGVQA